jgi:hypothetical protein
MTIEATTTVIRYDGDDNATEFSFPFLVNAKADLNAILTSAGGTDTTLAVDTDFEVAGVGVEGDGIVTYPADELLAPLATGEKLTLYRLLERKQLTSFTSQGTFRAENHEAAIDRLTMIAQELDEELDRCLKVNITSGDDGGVLEEDMSVIAAEATAARDAALVAQAAAEGASSTAVAAAAGALVVWRFGSGAPGGALGINGDNYIDTDNDNYYHKETGSWVLKGNIQGTNGADGQTTLSGAGAPGAGTGTDGDFYIDTTAWDIYGPKAGGAWGSGTSLVGPAGSGSGDVACPAATTVGHIAVFSGVKEIADGGAAGTAGLAVLACAAATSVQAALDLEPGVDVQAYDADTAKLDTAQSWTAGQQLTPGVLTSSSGSVAWDCSAKQSATLELSENVTAWALSNLVAGRYVALRVLQHASAAKTISWDSSKFKGMVGYTMSTTTSAADHLVMRALNGTVLELVGYRQGVQA